MANEFYQKFGRDVSVTMSPRGQSILEVFVDGERVFDRLGEGRILPDLSRVRKMQGIIADKIKAAEAVAADNN
jgi:predicted Rdx family selenoprotein